MKTFDVIYYQDKNGKKVYSHQYSETWDVIELYCPKCGRKPIMSNLSGGDYYVGNEFLCLICKHSFYLPDGITDQSKDEQGSQRLERLMKNDC